MAISTIKINSIIKDRYIDYCHRKGIPMNKKVEKLIILDLYKNGQDVKDLIILNKNKLKKEEQNGPM
jgi:hypothetical protein